MLTTHNLGFPANTINRQQAQTPETVWRQQVGSDLVSIGCDTVNDSMTFMMNVLGHKSGISQSVSDTKAQWFGSNLNFVVPNFTKDTDFSPNFQVLIDQVKQAKQTDLNVKPVIIGPISYLWFGEAVDGVNKLDLLESLLPVYIELLTTLADAGVEWVQLDEPILTQDLDKDWKHALLQAYYAIQKTPIKKLLANYFGSLSNNLGLLRELAVDGVHLDTISAESDALKVADLLPNYKIISVAVVDGSQHAETDFADTLAWLKELHEFVGDRLWLAPSCSLAHLPKESINDPELENAKLKMSEVKALAMVLEEISNNSNVYELNVRKAVA